jgi:large subunit ribosomal protein L5
MSFLREKYKTEVIPALMSELGITNPMQVPKVTKVVINMGLGEAVREPKIIEPSVKEVTKIAGQRAVITRARRSIATFKLREGMPIGVKATLRGERMFHFLERLLYIALPRVRDFNGVSTSAFDGHGNYSLGIREQIIFPEIDYDTVDKIRGLNITLVTTAENDEHARALLRHLGMPFRRKGQQQN